MTNKEKSNQNFIRQLAVYAGVAAFFFALSVGAGVIHWNFGQAFQMSIFVNIVMGLGFIVYLWQSDYSIDPDLRINDKSALYLVCLFICLIVISEFYRPDIGWANNTAQTVILIIEALFISIADETVFRAFGDFCFPVKGIREEASMVICYTAFYLYGFTDGTSEGIKDVILAFGMGMLFTGLYLRYHKLGANILYHFILIFLMKVTVINSTAERPVLGTASVIVFALGIAGMCWYGARLIQAYNKDGVLDDARLGYDGSPADYRRAYSESRDKFKGKVIDKAEPKIEKKNEEYINKQIAKAEKREAKRQAKEEAKRGKKDD